MDGGYSRYGINYYQGTVIMTSMTELEAMRQEMVSRRGPSRGSVTDPIKHDELVAFASALNQLLRAEGFTTTYPSRGGNDYTGMVVEGANEGIGIDISPTWGSLMCTLGYTDSEDCTIYELVSELREVLGWQDTTEYCKQCDYFQDDCEGAGCVTCLLDLEMRAGCTQRRIKGDGTATWVL